MLQFYDYPKKDDHIYFIKNKNMKNTKCIHGIFIADRTGFLSQRLVWDAPKEAPEVRAQREFKEIGELVRDLETRKSERQGQKNELVEKLTRKLLDSAKYVSPELLRSLAKRPETKIRTVCEMLLAQPIAENPRTPKDTLAKLAKHESNFIRGRVALNPATPVEILTILADDDSYVQSCVAQNPNTPKSIREKINNKK